MQPEIVFTHAPLVVPPVVLSTREIGSVLEFQGLVREMERGQVLEGLYYEAHESMARRLLERHSAALHDLHPVTSVQFIHRLGWVPVDRASLFIRVMSPHRAEGLHYLSAFILRLKEDVPIWKMPRPPGAETTA